MIRHAFFISLLAAGAAEAQVLDERAARSQLFDTGGYGMQVSGGLSEKDRATVQALIPVMAREMGQEVKYYTSIAYSPDDGLVSEALQGAINYHSPSAADAAAIAACNAARSGARPCELAARVVPRGFQQRPLTMSVDATSAFETQYRRARSPKAFAISRSTGAWGMGAGDGAALNACASGPAAARDCAVVIRD